MSRLMIVEVPSYSAEFKGIREVAELIRCKDCRKYKYEWCHKFANVVKPDDFCSYAERREEDENSSR